MKLRIENELPMTNATLEYQGKVLYLENVLLDTGSAGTIVAVDKILSVGLKIERYDEVHRIRGVGGSEFVYEKHVDVVQVGPLLVRGFTIQVGAMDYGLAINGIIGVDFLLAAGAVIDLRLLEIRHSV